MCKSSYDAPKEVLKKTGKVPPKGVSLKNRKKYDAEMNKYNNLYQN